jgi:flagellar motor protein MotB
MSGPGSETERSWIVSFADLLSVLLCFMVMLFGVSALQDHTPANFDDAPAGRHIESSSAAVPASLPRTDASSSLDLDYLAAVLRTTFAAEVVSESARIERRGGRLVISIPNEPPSASGEPDMPNHARPLLETLAHVLGRAGNRIVVIGHARPQPASDANRHSWDWEEGLTRALEVAELLQRAGLDRSLDCYGLADDDEDELRKASDGNRQPSVQGVDVVVYPRGEDDR